MAGRATELLVFGESEITQICQQDIIEATRIAYNMVVKYGFSNLGPLSIESKNNTNLNINYLRNRKGPFCNCRFRIVDFSHSLILKMPTS